MSEYRQLTDTEKSILGLSADTDIGVKDVITFGKALLTIAGADNELHELELIAFWQFMGSAVNLPVSAREELENFDFKTGNLDELTSQASGALQREAAKRLVLGAITISVADGEYHEKEKAATLKFAKTMGISEEVVAMIETVAIARRKVMESTGMLIRTL